MLAETPSTVTAFDVVRLPSTLNCRSDEGPTPTIPARAEDDRLQRAVVDRHVIEEFAIDDRRVTG
jgi:hypothetical protein